MNTGSSMVAGGPVCCVDQFDFLVFALKGLFPRNFKSGRVGCSARTCDTMLDRSSIPDNRGGGRIQIIVPISGSFCFAQRAASTDVQLLPTTTTDCRCSS